MCSSNNQAVDEGLVPSGMGPGAGPFTQQDKMTVQAYNVFDPFRYPVRINRVIEVKIPVRTVMLTSGSLCSSEFSNPENPPYRATPAGRRNDRSCRPRCQADISPLPPKIRFRAPLPKEEQETFLHCMRLPMKNRPEAPPPFGSHNEPLLRQILPIKNKQIPKGTGKHLQGHTPFPFSP